MKQSLKVILITLLSFAVYFILDDLFFNKIRSGIYALIGHLGLSHILTYILSGIPIYVGAGLIYSSTRGADNMGLKKPLKEGLIFPLLCTLPMFIGFAFVFKFNATFTWNEVWIGVVAAAFFEELFFRGFLFGQLYRYTQLGFLPAVLLGALLFASVHLYQSQDYATLAGIFATTFFGAVLFAWVFAEWRFNLWIPVFFHFFMNLSWLLYAVSDNALGNGYANIFRIMTVIFAVAGTVIYKKKKGIPLEVNRRSIWMKKVNKR